MTEKCLTKWGKELDPEHVLKEYPRPSLVRNSCLNLNGFWDYAITRTEELPAIYTGKILVPFSPETVLSRVNRTLQPDEYLHYRRYVRLDSYPENYRWILHFGAVDQSCRVYVNHFSVGEHTGGYLAFSFDITDYVKEGDNELQLAVQDLSDTSWHAKGKQSLEPGGMWYTAQSGIWQTVWMECVPPVSVADLKMIPDPDAGRVEIKIRIRDTEGRSHGLKGEETVPLQIRIYQAKTEEEKGEVPVICSLDERIAISDLVPEPDGTGGGFLARSFDLAECLLWTPETPYLYDVKIRFGEDAVASYFAMRKISVGFDSHHIPRLFLNDRPYYHNGVLDQGYYPDGLYTAPSDEAMINDILRMKELGFNMLRKHIKIEPERWYYHCDRLGMLVWQDMVCGGTRYLSWFVTYMPNILPFTGHVVRDPGTRKRPGTLPLPASLLEKLFSRKEAEGRKEFRKEVKQTIRQLDHHPSIVVWVPFNEGWGQFAAADMTRMIRRMDPTRLIDSASGWFDQGAGDFVSIHNYFRKLKIRPCPDRVTALTEFGGCSWQMPEYSSREKEYGYRKYRSKEELTRGICALWKRDLLPNLEKGLSASVYTQVSDVEEETNGLLTYGREAYKVDTEALKETNRELFRHYDTAVQDRMS